MKKKVMLFMGLVSATSLLAGCSLGTGNAKTAEEVIQAYLANNKTPNYHMDMSMSFGIDATAEGMSVNMPVAISLESDMYGHSLHGNMKMETSFMGMDVDADSEVYVVSEDGKYTVYSYDSEYGYWTVEEDAEASGVYSLSELDSKYFKDAEVAYDKASGIYTLTQSFEDFIKSDNNDDLVGSMSDSFLGMMDVETNDLYKDWEDLSVVYTFDKDFNLTSILLDDYSYETEVNEDGTKVSVKVEMGISAEFSNHGKIKESDVKVPASVIEEAVPAISLDIDDFDSDFSYDGEDEVDGEVEGEIVEGTETEGSTEGESEEVVSSEENSVPVEISGNMLGSYNGYDLTGDGNSWQNIFEADGWVFDNEDGEYSFMSAVNSSYEDAFLYVYPGNNENASAKEIEEKGVFGYSIDASYADNKPNMGWGGLTFGASLEDIESVYGEPRYSYEGSMYTVYTYKISETKEIEFTVYPDKGLQEVELYVY